MRIYNLTHPKSMIYSSNVYFVLGDWSALADVNTLIDVGNDPSIIERIRNASTGVGKKAVEQVILTHGHFDHTALVEVIRQRFNPVIYAHSPFIGADRLVKDGQELQCGDRVFQVLHTPGHSDDSICLYCKADGVLFAGDTPLVIRSTDGSYEKRFVAALERICQLDVRTIYFGHGEAVSKDAQKILAESLRNVKTAQLAA